MASHSRAASDIKASSTGGSYQLILEHVLAHPGTYEIPLRNMYHLNCLPASSTSRPTTPSGNTRTPSPEEPPPIPGLPHLHAANAQFTTSLFQQITRLPTQPCSLPPVFINSFLRRCFPRELNLVDFPQALTAIDYLKDLESRRRREHEAALTRLDITLDEFERNLEGVDVAIKQWIDQMEMHERKIDALYSNLYVALRRWVLINELTIQPFTRHNCLAMLNTLYPPSTVSKPTAKLTPDILKRQREGFFSYIQAVERRGPVVLKPLMEQNRNGDDENGWPKVRDILDKYLRVTMNLIEQYGNITSAPELIAAHREQEERRRRKEKVDSGVSFGSADGRPSMSSPEKRKAPPSPVDMQPMPLREKRNYSTLEKIARELRKFRDNRKRSGTLDSLEKENIPIHNTATQSFQSTASAPLPAAVPEPATLQPPPSSHGGSLAKGLRKFKSLGDMKMSRAAAAKTQPAVPALPSWLANDPAPQFSPRKDSGNARISMDRLRGLRKQGQTAFEV